MRALSLTSLAATMAVSLFSLNAFAATTVYEQAPTGPSNVYAGSRVNNAQTFDLAADPGFSWSSNTDIQSWDTFSLTSGVSFNRIGWYGVSSSANGNFAVDLFATPVAATDFAKVKSDGTFTHVAGSTSLLSPTLFSQSGIHKTFVSGSGDTSLYSYYIDLGSNIALTAGTGYAISIVNNYSYLTGDFRWASTAGSGVSYSYGKVLGGGSGTILNHIDLAFSLMDTNATVAPPVSAVPEPETYALMLAGLGLMGAVARRRKAKQAQLTQNVSVGTCFRESSFDA